MGNKVEHCELPNNKCLENLKLHYNLLPHPENGYFALTHYDYKGYGRASSGSIYYYLEKGQHSKFHKVDCDEYWVYHAGGPLEIWILSPDDVLQIIPFGLDAQYRPSVYIPKGSIFASKHPNCDDAATFMSCITVPRFSDKGFTLYEDEYITQNYPQLKKFFNY